MEIHNPTNLKLPALKMEKKRDRQLIENDSNVQNLIKSNLLLKKELNQLLAKLTDLTIKINNTLEDSKKARDYLRLKRETIDTDPSFLFRVTSRRYFPIEYIRKIRMLRHAPKRSAEKIRKEVSEFAMNEFKKENLSRVSELKRVSGKISNTLDQFEHSSGTDLDILISRPIYYCKKCGIILCIDRFHSTTCICKESINSINKVKEVTLHLFNNNMLSFINQNIWLEHGIDYLFRKKDYQTLCGVYVLGHSGVQHEIDNIAENIREQTRIFGECKNKNCSVNDVFVLSGKMLDVGCSRGYIFTTSTDTNKEMKQLAKSKNIYIIDSIIRKNENSLMTEIRE